MVETSNTVSSLASRVNGMKNPFTNKRRLAGMIARLREEGWAPPSTTPENLAIRLGAALDAEFRDVFIDAKSLAGSALAQDETKGRKVE